MKTETFPRLTWTSALVLLVGVVVTPTVWGASSQQAEAASEGIAEDTSSLTSSTNDVGSASSDGDASPPPARQRRGRYSRDAQECPDRANEGPPGLGRDFDDRRGPRRERGRYADTSFNDEGAPRDQQGPPPQFQRQGRSNDGERPRGPRRDRRGNDNWSPDSGLEGPGRRGHGPPDPEILFAEMDANEDGMLSKEEFMQFHEQRRPPFRPEHQGGSGPRFSGPPERGLSGPAEE